MRTPLMPFALVLLAGCYATMAPLYAPVSAAGVTPSGAPYSAREVEDAVVRGALVKGWTILRRDPDGVSAEVHAGEHSARVTILCNAGGWRILHESSSPGLRYSPHTSQGEMIHRRYNHWIRLLDEAIREALAGRR